MFRYKQTVQIRLKQTLCPPISPLLSLPRLPIGVSTFLASRYPLHQTGWHHFQATPNPGCLRGAAQLPAGIAANLPFLARCLCPRIRLSSLHPTVISPKRVLVLLRVGQSLLPLAVQRLLLGLSLPWQRAASHPSHRPLRLRPRARALPKEALRSLLVL
jgi:hypothetical protein